MQARRLPPEPQAAIGARILMAWAPPHNPHHDHACKLPQRHGPLKPQQQHLHLHLHTGLRRLASSLPRSHTCKFQLTWCQATTPSGQAVLVQCCACWYTDGRCQAAQLLAHNTARTRSTTAGHCDTVVPASLTRPPLRQECPIGPHATRYHKPGQHKQQASGCWYATHHRCVDQPNRMTQSLPSVRPCPHMQAPTTGLRGSYLLQLLKALCTYRTAPRLSPIEDTRALTGGTWIRAGPDCLTHSQA